MNILITGSSGLIGSTAANYFLNRNHSVIGVDNNMRQKFFGKQGNTVKQQEHLQGDNKYFHHQIDIRDKDKIFNLFSKSKIDVIIHTAAQPSHEKSTQIPLVDFEINAGGSLILLEATRKYHPRASFIFTSTNKVYGDRPNLIPTQEKKTRYAYTKESASVDESLSIDKCLHSLFGASKTAADIYVQEYGKYFGMNTTILRLGCITGVAHAGAKLHGFLSYLIKSLLHHQQYEIIGYKGKQVRDQLDAYDLATAFEKIIEKPNQGEVFNLGGGIDNNASINELITIISNKLNINPKISYVDKPRKGDHVCYISNINKFKKFYPNWEITKDLDTIINEIIAHEKSTKHQHFGSKCLTN